MQPKKLKWRTNYTFDRQNNLPIKKAMIKNLFVNKNSAKKKHINKTAITTIVTLSFCFNAFAQEAKGTDWTEEEWKKDKGGYGWVFPHIDKTTGHRYL